jgi:hypothetical protein
MSSVICPELVTSFILVSYFAYSATMKMEPTCSSENPLTFNGLYGVKCQNIQLLKFISTCDTLGLSIIYHIFVVFGDRYFRVILDFAIVKQTSVTCVGPT